MQIGQWEREEAFFPMAWEVLLLWDRNDSLQLPLKGSGVDDGGGGGAEQSVAVAAGPPSAEGASPLQ